MCNNIHGIILIVFVCCQVVPFLAQFQQQRAKVLQANPKYVKSISIFTVRRSRTSPYSTDFNMTTVVSWGNNVTIKSMYYKHKAKSDALTIELKACDLMKLKWARDWVQKYSNLSADMCPVRVGTYRFSGFEVPPKNIPMLFDKTSDYETTLMAYVTKTKEVILEINIDLKMQTKQKEKKPDLKAVIDMNKSMDDP